MLGRKGERAARGEPENEIIPDAADETADPPDDSAPESPEPSDAFEEIEAMVAENDADGDEDPAQPLVQELELANDRHLRLAAEFENFRKRTRREAMETSVVAQAEFARRLLPTLDDLARVSSTPPESTTVEALDQGLDLILRNLRKELQEIGLEPIDALGSRFDPELHQGVLTAETAEKELDDIVSRVFVDGYTFQGRLVRPAQVEVLNFSPDGDEEV